MKTLLGTSSSAINIGLLVIRLGIGAIFIAHGFPKLIGGTQSWQWLGSQMKYLGITFMPVFWGLLAAVAEFFGGIGLVLGLGTRLAALMLANVMIAATMYHIGKGDDFNLYSHPLSLLFVFLGLLITGAGAYSIDYLLSR